MYVWGAPQLRTTPNFRQTKQFVKLTSTTNMNRKTKGNNIIRRNSRRTCANTTDEDSTYTGVQTSNEHVKVKVPRRRPIIPREEPEVTVMNLQEGGASGGENIGNFVVVSPLETPLPVSLSD